MNTYHIHIEGQVQGVGFRPYVWHLARQYGLGGWVSNGRDGVHIEVSGQAADCILFHQSLTARPPAGAQILHHAIHEKAAIAYPDFTIRESLPAGATDIVITPDLGLCQDCRDEIRDPHNRRYQYAFTSCIHCGPRYSIQTAVPFDRAQTTMAPFTLCPTCQREYTSPADPRFHAQTNSCATCGVKLTAHDIHGYEIPSDTGAILTLLLEQLNQGNIVALKNIGGYLLLCDATREKAVALLRQRKQRQAKPLALLYPSLEAVRQDAVVSAEEAAALTSPEAPIVLLQAREDASVPRHVIAPGSAAIGVMLPYSPLMQLVMDKIGRPLIATSANVSGSPIHFRDREAFEELYPIADFFITHNRKIVVPQDDSVIRFSPTGRPIMLRRSRGYAPRYANTAQITVDKPTVAMGADLKSTFTVASGDNIHVSQYLGDLSSFDAQRNLQHTLEHMLKLLQVTPAHILADLHPNYHSSDIGRQLAQVHNASFSTIQHHEAHFAAVLAENALLQSRHPVLGVIFDGAGYGSDGNIWGGEYLLFDQMNITRAGHIAYFDHLLSDKFAREPRLAALSLCRGYNPAVSLIEKKFTGHELSVYGKMLTQNNLLKTSSAARLFDAAASLLDLCDRSSYEGEAAMLLETLAATVSPSQRKSLTPLGSGLDQSGEKLMISLVDARRCGVPKNLIAYRFHLTLVSWITAMAEQTGVERIAFSGGVFQNALLTGLLEQMLSGRYTLYFHQQLSPNDECLSLGQVARYAMTTAAAGSTHEISYHQA